MAWQQHTRQTMLTALVCTALTSGTAWAAVPEVTTVDVQQLSQAPGLIVEGQEQKKKAIEQERKDAQGHVQMGIADAGSKAAHQLQASQPSEEEVHEQAWDIMKLPLRWQPVEQVVHQQDAAQVEKAEVQSAKPQVKTVPTQSRSANKAASTTYQDVAHMPAPVPQKQAAMPQPQAKVAHPEKWQRHNGVQHIVEVPPAPEATEPIIITARDLEKAKRRELLQPHIPVPPSQEGSSATAAGTSTAVQAGKEQATGASVPSGTAGQQRADTSGQAGSADQHGADVTGTMAQRTGETIGQAAAGTAKTALDIAGAGAVAAGRIAAGTASAPESDAAAGTEDTQHRRNRQWNADYGKQEVAQAAADQSSAAYPAGSQPSVTASNTTAAQVPAGQSRVQVQADSYDEERPEPFRNISEATWKHIKAGILATGLMLQQECTEHGMYLLARMLNQNTSLTHLQKINYLIGIGYAINHSSLLNDWQKQAFLDAFLQFCK